MTVNYFTINKNIDMEEIKWIFLFIKGRLQNKLHCRLQTIIILHSTTIKRTRATIKPTRFTYAYACVYAQFGCVCNVEC